MKINIRRESKSRTKRWLEWTSKEMIFMANGITRFVREKVDFVWVNYAQLLRSLHNTMGHHLNQKPF